MGTLLLQGPLNQNINLAMLPSCHLNGRNRNMYTTKTLASTNSPAVTPAWILETGFMCSKTIRKGTLKYLHRVLAVSETPQCDHIKHSWHERNRDTQKVMH